MLARRRTCNALHIIVPVGRVPARPRSCRRRGRLQADLRRQDPQGLGRRSQVLERRGRRHHRPDHRRKPRQAEYLPHLARRQAGRLRAKGRVPHAQRRLRQLGHPNPKLGRTGEMAGQRLPARHGRRRPIHRHLLRRELPRHPRPARPEGGYRHGPQAEGRRAVRRLGGTRQGHQEARLERVRHHRPRKPHHREDQRAVDVRGDRRGQHGPQGRHHRPANPPGPADEGAIPQHRAQGVAAAGPSR